MTLDKAIEYGTEVTRAYMLAVNYHEGQVDKQGEEYFFHPLRVMLDVCKKKELMVAALLHDILEDTECTREILLECGISEKNVELVECLTRKHWRFWVMDVSISP